MILDRSLLRSLGVLLPLLASCGTAPERYELEGSVVSVDIEGAQVSVNHKAIPGFMGAMTMSFPVRPTSDAALDRIGRSSHGCTGCRG